jgi:hypothetical protein
MIFLLAHLAVIFAGSWAALWIGIDIVHKRASR